MSITYDGVDCQHLRTTITQSVQPWLQSVSLPTGILPVTLTTNQLALAAVWWPGAMKAIVTTLPSRQVEHFMGTATSWQTIHQSGTWHVLTEALSPPEIAGDINTPASVAMHHLLLASPYHHVILSVAQSWAVPDRATYQQSLRTWHIGESIPLRTALLHLHQCGYQRGPSIVVGGFTVRGEQIDIWHSTFPNHFTMTWHGNTIEQIIRHDGARTYTEQKIVVPPMTFPEKTMLLPQAVSSRCIFRPDHETTFASPTTVIYDALQSPAPFPWRDVANPSEILKSHHTYIAYDNLDRIRHFVEEHPHTTTTLSRTPLAAYPLQLATESEALLTERALFPPQSPTEKPVTLDHAHTLLAELRAGRPAVHIDHGIGIFEGLVTRQIGGNAHDYLLLRYAAGDLLSVPIEFAHKVTAYLGETTPPLHRLGGKLWGVTKRKAEHDAVAFAQELLAIARARSGREREAYYIDHPLEEALGKSFPFPLTADQTTAWEAVQHDLQRSEPMDRLIVGDVGFGKTEIALRAAYHVAQQGYQVAVLAPTTLLVQQHADTFRQRAQAISLPLPPIAVLSRFTTPREQAKIRSGIAQGTIAIAIGTHALLSRATHWKKLGLVIIDEEQRFGVGHKEHFKRLRANIDILSLSATPIPRTLSMALSGLKSLTVISTPPVGRKSVISHVGLENDPIIQEAITRELSRGGQVYVVAPKVRGLPALARYIAQLVPTARLGCIHGQLPSAQLAKIMAAFDAGEIDVLVSSTIIENGLDVPNANTIIVLQATHFGLSDLYQLRGRIGRSGRQGYALFLYRQQELTLPQRERLAALIEATRLGSGWSLAQRDLEIRGAGNFLGAQQSGAVTAVGVQLYLDMIDDAVAREEGQAYSRQEIDIHLPLSAIIPPTYIAEITERTQYYQRLSRATSLDHLAQEYAKLVATYGEAPAEVAALYTLLQLQHAAATWNIRRISHQAVTPSDEPAYARLSIEGRALPNLLRQVGSLGNWVVRGESITLDMDTISLEFVQRLLSALRPTDGEHRTHPDSR